MFSSIRLCGLVLLGMLSSQAWFPILGNIVWIEETNGTSAPIYSTYLAYWWAVSFTELTLIAFFLMFLGSFAFVSSSKLEYSLPILSTTGCIANATNLLMLGHDWSRTDSQFSLSYLVIYEFLWSFSALLLLIWLVIFGLVAWRAFLERRVYRLLPAFAIAGASFSLIWLIGSLMSPLRTHYFGLGLMKPIFFLIGFTVVPLSFAILCEVINLANELGRLQ